MYSPLVVIVVVVEEAVVGEVVVEAVTVHVWLLHFPVWGIGQDFPSRRAFLKIVAFLSRLPPPQDFVHPDH